MARQYPFARTLSKSEFDRAIWLDFEGVANSQPIFAGVLFDGDYAPWLIDENVKLLQESEVGIQYDEKTNFMNWIFELAERDNRCIIGYSVHEYDVIKKMVPEYTEKLNLYYRNALQLAKKHFGSEFHRKMNGSLKSYLLSDEVGYGYPSHLLDFSVKDTIASLWKHSCRNESFSDLSNRVSERMESKLHQLIEYNEHDCRGTEYLIGLTFE